MSSRSRQADPGLHRTTVGRVVYDRPLHQFSLADVERIMRALFVQTHGELGLLEEVLYTASIYFLRIILDLFGVGVFAPVVYYWVTNVVKDVLLKLEELLGFDVAAYVAQEIYSHVAVYLRTSEEEIVVPDVFT